MRKFGISSALFLGLVLIGCSDKQKPESGIKGDFSGLLTEMEIKNGILTPEILWKFGRLSDHQLAPDGSSVIFNVTRYDYHTNKKIADIFIVPTEGGKVTKLTSSDGSYYNARWRPDGNAIGYISSHSGTPQIWEMNIDGSSQTIKSDIEGGLNGFEYSPSGDKIFYLKDVKLEKNTADIYPDLPLANVRIIDDLMYRHWDSWSNYSYSHIFIQDFGNNKAGPGIDIMADEPWDAPLSTDFDIAQVSWSPDGKSIAYTSKKMKGKDYALSTNSDVYIYDIASGLTDNLSKGMPGYDRYPVFSPDGRKIAWQSMKTPGFEADKDNLYILDLSTGEKTNMSTGFDQDVRNLRWSADGNSIYFISGTKATFQLYKMDIGNKAITQITKGQHDYTSFSLASDFIVAEKMSMSMATELFRVDPENGLEMQLSELNNDKYENLRLGRVEERWVKTTDNKQMLVWVIFPPDFDPAKKYPALLYCQGGPQSAVSQFFSYRWNLQLMAANDYIIVAPNRRGLPTFGSAWNDQISGDYGGQNMRDYISAIDELKKEPYIDENRLGAVGASYGGYSVFYLAGHHEGRFKAFISHCGIYNLESMYASTEEVFFVNHDLGGPYWDKPKPISYSFSPHLSVDKWDTPIMIIAGENDFRIPYTESLQAFNAAQLRGIPSKLLVFPDETHFILKPQNSILWQREFFGWLDKYLKD